MQHMLLKQGGTLSVEDSEVNLEYIQEIVGGNFEVFRLDDEIDVYSNEEAKFIEGLKPTLVFHNKGDVTDFIQGDCVIVSHDEEGNTTQLTDKHILKVMEVLKPSIMQLGNVNYTVKILEVNSL